MGKIIIRPKKSTSTISGYDVDFPPELNGVLTLKEWDMLITIINQNMIRHHVSIWLASPVLFFVGAIFIIVLFIVGIVRWVLFKSNAEKDLIALLASLNPQLSIKGVSIGYHKSQATFTLEITYPDRLTRPIQGRIYKTYFHSKPIFLETYASSMTLINPNIHKQPYHPSDPRLRSLLISSKCTSLSYMGWEGFETAKFLYPYDLYNYLTPQEYKAILEDYNRTLVGKMETASWYFFLVSCILIVALIGFVLIIPALIWVMVSRDNYRKKWDEKLFILNNKYTQLYASRGLSFHFHSTRHDLPRGYLNIHAPLDCGPGPTYTVMTGKKAVISATVPDQLQPLFAMYQPLSPTQGNININTPKSSAPQPPSNLVNSSLPSANIEIDNNNNQNNVNNHDNDDDRDNDNENTPLVGK